jgi:hypothetical protein
MLDRLHQIHERLSPFRGALLSHPIYREIDRMEALQALMEHHVFAVWDFMSLLKSLQRRLCCVEVPWLPAADPMNSRLINEIVLGEESDEDGHGGFASHFQLYHQAMSRYGANTAPIDGFLSEIRSGKSVLAALESPGIPACAARFVKQTFACIESGNIVAIASAFTFGREDLLPAVFQRIVDDLNVLASGGLQDFMYYLERHIGLDSDTHGPMANRLLASLCGTDESRWQSAEQAAIDCMKARQELWDGICEVIRRRKAKRL